jgi:hypothetical protein
MHCIFKENMIIKSHTFLLKILLILVLLFSVFSSKGQKEETISVKKIKWNVRISAPDSIFWISRENEINIDVKGGMNYVINITGGTISKKTGKYIVSVKEEGASTITVFEKLPGNKLRVLASRLFQVKRIPSAYIFVCGVRADSVIDKQQIINDNVITAYHPFYKMNLPVVGFDVIFTGGGKTETLRSSNNHFTIEMRKRIYSLKSGTLLYFENVYYILPDGSKEKKENFEVFVSETNKYKVGYRVWGL